MSESEVQWRPEVLPDGWIRAAAELTDWCDRSGLYLAGGTGLALYLGHRRSVDLDLFTPVDFTGDSVRDELR